MVLLALRLFVRQIGNIDSSERRWASVRCGGRRGREGELAAGRRSRVDRDSWVERWSALLELASEEEMLLRYFHNCISILRRMEGTRDIRLRTNNSSNDFCRISTLATRDALRIR